MSRPSPPNAPSTPPSIAHRAVAVALLCIAVTSTLLSQPAVSVEPWRIVVRVNGRVESRQAEQAWSPVWRSRILSDGDAARTLARSRAVIRLADQSEFTVGSNSVVEMSRFSLTPEGRTVVFNLMVGKVRARVARVLGKQSRFEIHTPNAVLAARGTDFYVEQLAPATTRADGSLAQRGSSDLQVPGPPTALGGNTYVIVFSGRVDASTTLGRQTFMPGDFGVINVNGAIYFNPPSFHPHGPVSTRLPDPDMQQPASHGASASRSTAQAPGSAYEGDPSANGNQTDTPPLNSSDPTKGSTGSIRFTVKPR